MALKRRAGPRDAVEAAPEDAQLVAFRVGGELYGIPIALVSEIDRMQPVTRVPKALPFVEGVIHLRGVIIPVIDLAKRFGLEPIAPDRHTRVVIARLGDVRVGLVVTAVTEVLSVPVRSVGPAPPLTFDPATRFVEGMARVGDGLISILSLDRLLSREEVEQLQQQRLL